MLLGVHVITSHGHGCRLNCDELPWMNGECIDRQGRPSNEVTSSSNCQPRQSPNIYHRKISPTTCEERYLIGFILPPMLITRRRTHHPAMQDMELRAERAVPCIWDSHEHVGLLLA